MKPPVHASPLLKAVEAAMFSLPTATKDNAEVLRITASAYLRDKSLWQRIGQSDRSTSLVRVLRTLVSDPGGPGFEQLIEYEGLCKKTLEVNGPGWQEITYEDDMVDHMFAASVSKLSELTLDEVFVLRSTKAQADLQGKDWLQELWERVGARDPGYAHVHDLVMRRLDWVRSLNDADFELPVSAHYGRIRTGRENADLLFSFGVELGHYDNAAEAYHVRVNARAYRALQPYRANFPLVDAQTWEDTRALSELDKHDPDLLAGAKAYLTFLVHSHHGDGSAATNRSGMRDHWRELLDEVTELQIEHAANSSLRRHTEGRSDPTPTP